MWYNLVMAKYPTPVNYMNRKQLQRIARNKRLAFNANTTKAALVTAINA